MGKLFIVLVHLIWKFQQYFSHPVYKESYHPASLKHLNITEYFKISKVPKVHKNSLCSLLNYD